jgi:anti-sigma28 factor (negative regulator of flagellin synthesis)
MKIQSTSPIAPVGDPGASAGRQPSPEQDQGATKVSLSSDAAFVESMREQASPAPFRDDLVAEVREQLAAGTFEQSVDMERTLDSLMAGL